MSPEEHEILLAEEVISGESKFYNNKAGFVIAMQDLSNRKLLNCVFVCVNFFCFGGFLSQVHSSQKIQ